MNKLVKIYLKDEIEENFRSYYYRGSLSKKEVEVKTKSVKKFFTKSTEEIVYLDIPLKEDNVLATTFLVFLY